MSGRTILRAVVATLALIAVFSGAKAAQPAHSVMAFVGVDVVPMTDAVTLLRDQTVLVDNGLVTAIGPRSATAVPRGATRIDGGGRTLIPGLTDMHAHLEYVEDPEILKLFVAQGVTTVRSMDGRPWILDWRRRVAARELVGPAIVTAGPIIDGSPPQRDDNLAVADASAAAAAVDAQAAAGYDFIKVYTNLSPEALRGAAAAARRHGLPISGHVPREVELTEALRTFRSIEHLADYGDAIDAREASARRWHWSNLFLAMPADAARMTELAGELARSGVWAVPTLVQTERALARPEEIAHWCALPEAAAVPAPFLESWAATVSGASRRLDEEDWRIAARGRSNRMALVAALHRAGANILAGSDTPNPFVVPGVSLHDELALLVEAGLQPGEALIAATRDAARYLGQDGLWGTIEPGRRADLVLLAANPLVDISATRLRIGVMAGGRWHARPDLDRMERALVAE